MSYRLDPREPMADGIRRVLAEQVREAIGHLHRPAAETADGIHAARKCMKRCRAVLRLVREELGDAVYRPENALFRDSARRIASTRELAAAIETLDGLRELSGEDWPRGAWKPLREWLEQRLEGELGRYGEREGTALEEISGELSAVAERIAGWRLEASGFGLIEPGLKRTYRGGRQGFESSRAEPSAENLHEWRKQVKYRWYQTRLLAPAWPDVLKPLCDGLHDLSTQLGLDHDLAEFDAMLEANPGVIADDQRFAVGQLIERHRLALRPGFWVAGYRFYTEKPKAYIRRLGAWWEAGSVADA